MLEWQLGLGEFGVREIVSWGGILNAGLPPLLCVNRDREISPCTAFGDVISYEHNHQRGGNTP